MLFNTATIAITNMGNQTINQPFGNGLFVPPAKIAILGDAVLVCLPTY